MSDSVPSRPRSAALIYAAAWLPMWGVIVAVYLVEGTATLAGVRSATWAVLPLALFGIPVVRHSTGLAAPEVRPARRVWTHLAQGAAYVAVTTVLIFTLYWADRTLSARSFRPNFQITAYQALMNSLVYATLAGVAHARAQAQRAELEATRAARAEALRARSDLALLRSQLNPHFVLNVLHGLLGTVRRDPSTAERAIEQLGGLLGHALRVSREDRDLLPLREEWEFVLAYLELEKLRLGDRLRLDLAATPEALGFPVPSFSLHPLVENAIVHAVAPRAEGGTLRVRAERAGDRLRATVEDDGPGAGPRPATEGRGVGLHLLRERLAALYGAAATLSLEPVATGGLRAILDLPADPEREGDDA